MANNEDKDWKMKVVTLDDAASLIAGEAVELDFEADAFSFPPPPPRGLYDVKLFPAKEAIHMCRLDVAKGDEPGNVYYRYNLVAKVVSEGDYKDAMAFPNVNTMSDRRGISTLIGLCILTGNKPKKNKLNMVEQLKIMDAVLKKEPIIRNVLMDWRCWSKTDEREICGSMFDFPKKADGTYSHIISHTNKDRGKDELTAQFFVKAWAGKERLSAEGNKGAATAKGTAAAPVAIAPMPEMAFAEAPSSGPDLSDLL